MRLFQNAGIYASYIPQLRALTRKATDFDQMQRVFLSHRFGAAHILEPVLAYDPSAFFTNGDDLPSQQQWASENGMPKRTHADEILLAQIEHHRADVFYNLDPMRYGSDFIRRLPGCVRKSIGWRAAPSPGADFEAYDLMLCNFPSILESYRIRGWKAAYFTPAHDPVMNSFAENEDRPIDVLFVGGYTRHHRRRAELLEAVAALQGKVNVHFHLDRSRLTRLAESPIGHFLPLTRHRRPASIQAVSKAPLFGLDLYGELSHAKIVLNGAIDMAGTDRGNMRCFEAMGCGALMLSDAGDYPKGMADKVNMLTYDNVGDAVSKIGDALQRADEIKRIARQGFEMISTLYSKSQQWKDFQMLADNV